MQADNPGREQKNTRNVEALAWIWHAVTSSVSYQPKRIHKISPVSKGLELDSTSLQVELQSHSEEAGDTELGSCVHTVYHSLPSGQNDPLSFYVQNRCTPAEDPRCLI